MRDGDVCPYLNVDSDMGKTIPYCGKCDDGTVCDHCIPKAPEALLGEKPMSPEDALLLLLLMAMTPNPDSNGEEGAQ